MSIDVCYETAISKLTNQGKIVPISKKLLSFNTNHERVLFVAEILRDLHLYPNIEVVVKSDNVSTYYRNHGNKCFQKSEDYEAWQYYNLSLLHAPINSENYALAIANRSAVFFSLQKYKDCLQDVEQVFLLTYPEKITDKLIKRKNQCQEFVNKLNCQNEIDQNLETENILRLRGSRNEKFLCASSKLDVVCNEDMGRHVIAKEDIKVGEVLAEENPYFTLLLKSQYLFVCSYCLSRKLNLLPCGSCCFALYCSTHCRDSAWNEYHEVECHLMPTLLEMEFTKLELLALRTVIKARNDHSDWTGLFKTIEIAEANNGTKLHGQVKVTDNWVYDSKYYTSIHTLSSNMKKRSISDIFQKSVTAAVFLYLLSEKTNFLKCQDKENKDDVIKCVAGILLHHTMTVPTNMHGIRSNIQTPDGNFVDEVDLGSAPYAFLSLLNHSCAPNVVRFSKLGTGCMKLFALRPIKRGMQLFDNYGAHHALEDRRTRYETLKFQYKFDCSCEACLNNWPTYFGLEPAKNLPARIIKHKEKLLNMNIMEKLQKGDIETASELFQPLCDLVETLDPYAPCKDLADCQESLKQCLAIFEGLVPYGYSKLINWPPIPPKV